MTRALLAVALAWFIVAASATAGDRCDATCPRGAISEGEPCGASLNNVCASAVPIACGQTVCGTAWASNGTRDFDWFTFTLAQESSVTVSGAAALPIGVLIAKCTTLGLPLDYLKTCGAFDGTVCLSAGAWSILVLPTDATGFPCGEANDYWFSITCTGATCPNVECGDPAAGSCYLEHGTPSCELAECCENVCGVDPLCCKVTWDEYCVADAFELCNEPPLNDVCSGALVVAEGVTPISFNAALEGPPLPKPCVEGGGTSMSNDVWFSWTATRKGSASVSVCAEHVANPIRFGVYQGSCDALELVGCIDDPTGCAGSATTIPVACGETFLIQASAQATYGTLTIDQRGSCCASCTGDLNDDGIVDAADLAILLGEWSRAGECVDLDGSGLVGAGDLGVLLGAWGTCR